MAVSWSDRTLCFINSNVTGRNTPTASCRRRNRNSAFILETVIPRQMSFAYFFLRGWSKWNNEAVKFGGWSFHSHSQLLSWSSCRFVDSFMRTSVNTISAICRIVGRDHTILYVAFARRILKMLPSCLLPSADLCCLFCPLIICSISCEKKDAASGTCSWFAVCSRHNFVTAICATNKIFYPLVFHISYLRDRLHGNPWIPFWWVADRLEGCVGAALNAS